MRVLLLSCNTGQGHNTAAGALYEELQRRDIPCECKDALLFGGEKTSKAVSRSYTGIAVKAPAAFGLIYQVGKAYSRTRLRSPVYLANKLYAKDLRQYILQQQFDTVICTHLFPAEALTYLKRKHALDALCCGVATDYTCIPFWEEIRMDLQFIAHPDLKKECVRRGMNAQSIRCTGIPVSARFNSKTGQAQARRLLGLPESGPIFLMMTGSMGFGHILKIARQLLVRRPDCQIVILTGRNETLRRQVEEQLVPHRVRAVPFTDQVPLYMDACDVTLTKPGGLTATEAAVKNVPLVFTDPIPGCETKNLQFFEKRGMALAAKNEPDAAAKAIRLTENPTLRQAMLEAQRRNINKDAAAQICRQICAHKMVIEDV